MILGEKQVKLNQSKLSSVTRTPNNQRQDNMKMLHSNTARKWCRTTWASEFWLDGEWSDTEEDVYPALYEHKGTGTSSVPLIEAPKSWSDVLHLLIVLASIYVMSPSLFDGESILSVSLDVCIGNRSYTTGGEDRGDLSSEGQLLPDENKFLSDAILVDLWSSGEGLNRLKGTCSEVSWNSIVDPPWLSRLVDLLFSESLPSVLGWDWVSSTPEEVEFAVAERTESKSMVDAEEAFPFTWFWFSEDIWFGLLPFNLAATFAGNCNEFILLSICTSWSLLGTDGKISFLSTTFSMIPKATSSWI